jgi:uncharacterized membrane protein
MCHNKAFTEIMVSEFRVFLNMYEGRLKSSWTHYSESELFGGAVTVYFSKYLPWQAIHFLQRSTHVLQVICRVIQEDSGTAAMLGLPL